MKGLEFTVIKPIHQYGISNQLCTVGDKLICLGISPRTKNWMLFRQTNKEGIQYEWVLPVDKYWQLLALSTELTMLERLVYDL